MRDQALAIREAVRGRREELVNKALEKCVQERYLSAVTFSELITMYEDQDKSVAAPAIGKIILMDQNNSIKAETKPDKSDLDDYEKVFSK